MTSGFFCFSHVCVWHTFWFIVSDLVKAVLPYLGSYWEYILENSIYFNVIYAWILYWTTQGREATTCHFSAAVTWCCFVLSGWYCNDCTSGGLEVMMSFVWIMMRDKMRCCLLSGDRGSLSNVFHQSVYTVWFSGWWIYVSICVHAGGAGRETDARFTTVFPGVQVELWLVRWEMKRVKI